MNIERAKRGHSLRWRLDTIDSASVRSCVLRAALPAEAAIAFLLEHFRRTVTKKWLRASLATLVAKQRSSCVQKESFEQHEKALTNSD